MSFGFNMLRFLKQSVAGILVGILCIQIPFGALAQDGGETSEPVQTREYGFDDPRLKQQEIPLARETTSEFEALSVEIDPTNLEKSKESLQRFVDEFTEFAEGGFEEPKELIKRTSKYAYKRQLFSAINTIYRYMLVAKGIVTSSEGIPDFLYGADRFFRHNLETKEKLTRAVVTSFMISHAIEMSVFPASVADMNLTGSIVGFVIQIPGLDPLCWTTAWLLVRLEPLRNGMYKLNLFVVKRFPGPLFNALGAELALRFMYEKSRGELFRELRNPYEIETVRRNFDANKNEIDFSFKTSDGKKYMGMVFKTEPKQMLRLKSVWFHPEHLRSVSNQQINAELKPFGGRINNLMKQYIKAIQSGDAGVEQIVQNDPSKKSFLRTTEADGTQSILLNLHDQVMKPLSQNKSYFDWYFYSSQHAAIKHLKNVDSALVEKAQGEFLELLRKQMREHSFRDDVFKMEKFIEHALTRVTATMNPETRTHFLGQVFRNGDVFLFSHEHAYALQDDLRRSNNDDSKATEVEFKKIVALTQATFFNQLMGIKNVASYYHAAKALLSKFTLPDETSVRDMANERFQNTEPSDALRRGYKFAIAFNKPHNSKHIDDNRMVEVDNWLSTQKSIPKYDYVLPAVEQIKGKSIAELMPMLEKIPVAYIGVEGERYVAAVNQIDAELKRLRANAKQSAQAQHQYDQTIRSLGKIANKSMGTSVFDQPKNFSQKFLVESGKFAVALLVSESLRWTLDPNADLDDILNFFAHAHIEMARFVTFAGGAGFVSALQSAIEKAFTRQAGNKLESQALTHLQKVAGPKKLVSKSTAKIIVNNQISFIAGLVTNGLIWGDARNNPEFYRNMMLKTVPAFGVAQIIVKTTASKARVAWSSIRTGTKGLRVMAFETGPAGWLIAGAELGLEMTIAFFLEDAITSKELRTALEKDMRDYGAALSSEITGGRSKKAPESCNAFPVQSQASLECIGNELKLKYVQYVQFEVLEKIQATHSDSIKDEKEIVEDYSFIRPTFMDGAYVVNNVIKQDRDVTYASFKEMIDKVYQKNMNHQRVKQQQYQDVMGGLDADVVTQVEGISLLQQKSDLLIENCTNPDLKWDQLLTCVFEAQSQQERYEDEIGRVFFDSAGFYADERWYKRIFSSVYDGTWLGLEFGGELDINEMYRGIQSRGKSLISTTKAQKSRITNPEKYDELLTSVCGVLLEQMELMQDTVSQIRKGAAGEEIRMLESASKTPKITQVDVNDEVLPMSYQFPVNDAERYMDYKDHEINMITSPIKEVAVWLPRYEDPSNIHGVSNVVGSRDENVRFQLANYLVQDVWSQMDREKFNRAYGADLKQVEADLNDREKNKYLNTSGIKEGLWAMFKSKHQEETADQNARFNEAKLDLIVQLTGELEHESYPMQSTPTESLCYEVQYYYESFYLNDDMSMSFPSSITASGNPFLSHGATSHIPCSKIDVLRSRILNVMN